ncbi:hypothetical protein ABK249_18715 [Neorhizobium sp. Rsf11]|uniref:Uncharacterized protein n=2 Tax=Neorhizobium TaxID=1525371 RepID=A0ABV0M531_9HYPH|nr:hypothetical protein [Neorhizobium petrolearium]MCC2612976.1 hypothetical protein [Neorhizobium petrolearium]WGI68079.1 hypothetical protein QEO92_24475 [Neorhizobium petrolearium]
MSHDALFQSGMGSVEFDAPRTEEFFKTLVIGACPGVFSLVFTRTRRDAVALVRTAMRQRGMSAKALVRPRIAVTIPS